MNAHLQRGMSIVELMVAIVISLVGILVIFQVFANSEAIRRSTTGGADQQTNGLMALLQIERELKAAGYMINDPGLLGCTMKTYDTERTPSQRPDFALAPVEIISNNGTTSDVIRTIYGQPNLSGTSIPLTLSMETATDQIVLKGRFGIRTGDVLLLGQLGAPNCTLVQATGLPSDKLLDVEHKAGTYYNEVAKEQRTARFNDPAGTPLYQAEMGKVMNIGQQPVYTEMWVRNDAANPKENHQLVSQNLWAQVASPVAIADQIVQLKAEYGMDDGVSNGTVPPRVFQEGDNLVDKYTGVSPQLSDAKGWARVRTVRIAIVSRSSTPEKPTVGPACDATPDWGSPDYPIVWAKGPDAPAGRAIDVRTTADWRCYKYHVYETVVPLRNVLWRQ